MKSRLTESEWRRITEFAKTPKHQRCPELLLPEGTDAPIDGAEPADRA